MERFISRSVSSIQWRSLALLRSMRPHVSRRTLCSPGMALDGVSWAGNADVQKKFRGWMNF